MKSFRYFRNFYSPFLSFFFLSGFVVSLYEAVVEFSPVSDFKTRTFFKILVMHQTCFISGTQWGRSLVVSTLRLETNGS